MDPSRPIEERLQELLNDLADGSGSTGFDVTRLAEVELLSASEERQSIGYAFRVHPSLCNRSGTLHGGAASTLFDTLTSTALLTLGRLGKWETLGVSRTLSVTFMRPMSMNTKVFLECEVVAAGKKMANLRGTMRSPEGKICAMCIHDKAAIEGPKL